MAFGFERMRVLIAHSNFNRRFLQNSICHHGFSYCMQIIIKYS